MVSTSCFSRTPASKVCRNITPPLQAELGDAELECWHPRRDRDGTSTSPALHTNRATTLVKSPVPR